MLLQAIEIHYDYNNKRVSAVGNVQIYYSGSTIEADKVIYDETTKRLHAEGNVRLTEADGKITYSDSMDLSDDFRDGFVDSLRLDTPDKTRMAAARADRSSGTFTVFHSGVYTACEPARTIPRSRRSGRSRRARMIHDSTEKMIYFEDARLEFFGQPVAYMPYFSAPDPTVKRKSGFLMPWIVEQLDQRLRHRGSVLLGAGARLRLHVLAAPDDQAGRAAARRIPPAADRWRLLRSAPAASISSTRMPSCATAASATPGYRNFRGSIETTGQFALSDKWTWGWDGIVPTDQTFFQNYGLSTYQRGIKRPRQRPDRGRVAALSCPAAATAAISIMRTIYYYGFSEADSQSQIPVIHPVIDYSYVFGQPVLGGELSYQTNLTSLSRVNADFNPISSTAFANGTCALDTADPAAKIPANCLLRGVPGPIQPGLRRGDLEAQHHRSVSDRSGRRS